MADIEDALAHEERKRKWRESGARYRAKQTPEQKKRVAERAHLWKENNRERWTEICRSWRETNRDKWNTYCRELSKLHPEWGKSDRAKDYRKEWYQRHRAKIAKRGAERKAENPEYYRLMGVLASRAWRVRNADEYRLKARISSAARRVSKSGRAGTHTVSDILDILKSQRGRCAYCRRTVRSRYHVDHIQAISRGGSNHRNNLQITCARCNLRKNAKDPIDFAQSLGFLL